VRILLISLVEVTENILFTSSCSAYLAYFQTGGFKMYQKEMMEVKVLTNYESAESSTLYHTL